MINSDLVIKQKKKTKQVKSRRFNVIVNSIINTMHVQCTNKKEQIMQTYIKLQFQAN